MSKERSAAASLLGELFQSGLYKRNQGRIARQVTFGVIAVIAALGAWRMHQMWMGQSELWKYGMPGLVLLAGLWIGYRIVNISSFADFLISVEGEMAKVSWPSRTALIRSSIVVIFTIILLAAVLFAYDLIWRALLRLLGVVQ